MIASWEEKIRTIWVSYSWVGSEERGRIKMPAEYCYIGEALSLRCNQACQNILAPYIRQASFNQKVSYCLLIMCLIISSPRRKLMPYLLRWASFWVQLSSLCPLFLYLGVISSFRELDTIWCITTNGFVVSFLPPFLLFLPSLLLIHSLIDSFIHNEYFLFARHWAKCHQG